MIKNVFARYLVLLTVGGSLLGGAAVGLAGLASAATTNGATGPGYSYAPSVKAKPAPTPEARLAQPPRRLAHQRPERQVIAQHVKVALSDRGGLRSFAHCRQQAPRRSDPARCGPRSSVSSAHSGSAGGPRWPQPRGQSLIASARSENASITSSGSMWASPNDRMPGVSITQPRTVSGSATDCDDVCRPLPTPDTSPVARSASAQGDSPAWTSRPRSGRAARSILSTSSGATASSGSSRPAIAMVRSRPANCAANGSGGGEVGLGQAQDRRQPAGVGGDQRAVDEAGARRRVGERDHDQQLVGVGDDDPLGRDRCRRRCAATPFGGPRAARCGPGCRCARTGRRPRRRRRRPRSACGPVRGPASRSRMRSGSRPSAQPHRPRSTVTTMPSSASAWSGRVLVRGREPRPGRIRTSDSS